MDTWTGKSKNMQIPIWILSWKITRNIETLVKKTLPSPEDTRAVFRRELTGKAGHA
jgi:hypothetical protein